MTVTVTDTEAPVLGACQNVEGAILGPNPFTLPAATDNSGNVTVTCFDADNQQVTSPASVGPGGKIISCRATDASGLQSTSTCDINFILDTVKPTLSSCPSDLSLNLPLGQVSRNF